MRKKLRFLPLIMVLLAVVAWPQAAPQHSVSLSWTASTSTVVGYNVYRGTTTGGPYTKISPAIVTGLTYNDFTVSASTTYFYAVTAVDASGFESVNSNEATAAVPGNPLPPSGLQAVPR